MMTQKQKIELLAPAGNFEKLEIAVHYGADAVYLAGKNFSLRNFSGNFSDQELRDAIIFARERGVKVYVACNIYPRNEELEAISEYLAFLGEICPDAVIIADPGILAQAVQIIPEIPIHLSTQANTTNYRSVQFWENLGVRRINAARELSLREIKEIAEHSSVEIEAFVHGAMCISYSGRCLLSNFMAKRDSNRGMCCHPCRFHYTVMEEKRPGQYYPLMEDGRGAYIFNSKDLCMIEYLPEMIAAGITSLKIEGRVKGINYLASAVKTYREALDAYCEHPQDYKAETYWLEELARINSRGYCSGFYFGDPEQTVPNYTESLYSPKDVFLGKVIAKAAGKGFCFEVRNKIFKGDAVEVMTRRGPVRKDSIREIINEEGEFLSFANPNSCVIIILDSEEYSHNDLVRGKIKQ
ncbi:MAG: peptidase U32 [Desulfobacteraceae bacterium IS3]|nr:MAG: peptidase U32 [Desulfobacteraceae bacterium IS3]